MTDMLYTLLGGVVLIAIVFVLLYRFTHMGGKVVAGMTAMLVIGITMPIVILDWPGADVFAIHIAVYLVTVYVLGIVAAQRDARKQAGSEEGWFHWGPAALVIFFMLVIGADSIFIFLAQKGVDSEIAGWLLPAPRSGAEVSSHFPGVVARDYRKQHEEFNQFQQRMQEQQERGWQVQKGWLGEARAREVSRFKLHVTDNAGTPIRDAQVKGVFMRAGNTRLDQNFTMQSQADEPGSYLAELTLPEAGRWELLLRIRKGEALHEIKATTTVEPATE